MAAVGRSGAVRREQQGVGSGEEGAEVRREQR